MIWMVTDTLLRLLVSCQIKRETSKFIYWGGGPTPNMLEFAIWGWGKMGKSGEKWGKLKTSKFMFRKNFFINYSS